MKIAVYAIAKDEGKFVERWLESVKDADCACVADTGSTDNTAWFLKKASALSGVISIDPWRFDDARNAALALVPADVDICVSLDLDEVIQPGWRAVLEAAWAPGIGSAYYTFKAGWTFFNNRIHSRHGWRWKYPCHEGLYASGTPGLSVTIPDLVVEHHPDDTKPRPDYLALLALGLAENPLDQRMTHYYGRELMYRKDFRGAIVHFERYLAGPANFPLERSYTAQYLAECWKALA
jgi:glycosyltransferase involved in cell wall biosynthesis